MVGSTKYVEGNTRIQKYGIFVHERIPEMEDFYKDWRTDQFGGYSPKLALDLKYLQEEGFVNSTKIHKGNREVNRYEISEKGRKEIESLIKDKKGIIEKICEITQHYFSKSLKELLADAYILYPQYTMNSTIKAQVGKENIKHTHLSPEFELPFEEERITSVNFENLTSISEHIFNDEDLREKLSKIIGLEKTPSLDAHSFDRLSGILGNKIKKKEVDSIELVSSFRGS